MKKLITLGIIIINVNYFLSAQVNVFQKTFGGALDDYGFDVTATSDGGYALAGFTNSFGAGNQDVLLIKTDSNANVLWSHQYGGGGTDQAAKIIQTSDGGFALCGTTTSYGAGATDVLLIKTDSLGGMQWMKAYGGILDERAYNFRETSDNGFIIAGSTLSFGQGNWDMMFIKTNTLGDTLWTKVMGGVNSDQGTDAIQTNDGEFIFSGRTESWGAGMTDAFLCKMNNLGDTLWTHVYGSPYLDEGMKVKQTTDGGYILTGSSTGFANGTFDAWLNRIDSSGHILWSRIYAGLQTDATYDVLQLDDGGFIIAGETESFGNNHARMFLNHNDFEDRNIQPGNHIFGTDHSNILVIRTDMNGDTLWSRAYGGSLQDEGYSIIKTSDKGFMLLSYAKSFSVDSTYDFYLIKTDSLGFSGCNDDQVFPDVITPAVVEGNTSLQIASGISVFSSVIIPTTPNVAQNTLCTSTGLNEDFISEKGISIYPNPAFSEARIIFPMDFNNYSEASVFIYDVYGRLVKTFTPSDQTSIIIPIKNITPGLYVVKIVLSYKCKTEKHLFVSKLIIE